MERDHNLKCESEFAEEVGRAQFAEGVGRAQFSLATLTLYAAAVF